MPLPQSFGASQTTIDTVQVALLGRKSTSQILALNSGGEQWQKETISDSSNVSLSIVEEPAITTTSLRNKKMDLRQYLPNANSILTWFTSHNPAHPLQSVRWSSNINTTARGDTWWRWQFSAWPNQNFYDILYWSKYDNNLHYSETRMHCDNAGENCKDVTSFSASVVYGPRYYIPGTTVTGSGTTPVKRVFSGGTCTGTVVYYWKVEPYKNELNWNKNIRTNLPIVHFSNNQIITITNGPCSSFSYEEHDWFGTVYSGGTNQKTMVHTWGGAGPYTNDTNHWILTFLKTEIKK